MLRLLKYLKGYALQSVLAPLFKMLEAIFELLVPLIVASLIDTGIAGKNSEHIIKMCIVLVLLGVAGLGFSITAQYFAAASAVGFAARVRRALFVRVNRLSFSQLDRLGSSTLQTRLVNDVNQLQSGVNMFLRLFLRSPFIVFGAMIMAFTIDLYAALIFVGVIALLFTVIIIITKISSPLYRRVQRQLDGVSQVTRENLQGVRVIRAFCRQSEERARFVQSTELLRRTQLFVGRISALINPLTFVLINLGIAMLIYTGGVRVQQGLLTQGAVVALYNYMSQILVELVKFANCVITLSRSFAAAARVNEVLELPEPSAAVQSGRGEPDRSAHIQFEQVDLKYSPGGEAAIEGISLAIARGEILGIIGGTGSGKSSLAQLLPRFYEPTSGRVYVDGRELREYELKEIRDKIGIVMQNAVLFSGSIRDNLLWGNENATDEQLWRALETAQAADFVRAREGGLDSLLNQGAHNLSGGQRQRLNIARALVREPQILILDDSFSALDYATDLALRRALAALPARPTTLIISQRTASVMNADRIVVMDDGRIVAVGRHEQLLESCEIYAEIYRSQFGGAADA